MKPRKTLDKIEVAKMKERASKAIKALEKIQIDLVGKGGCLGRSLIIEEAIEELKEHRESLNN